MKTLTTTLLIITLSFGATSCKSTSKAKTTTETASNEDEKTVTKDMTYDMILSFISKGEGIDQKLKSKIDVATETFNKANKSAIKPEITNWGREGERDYNYSLKNLSTAQKKAFISSIEETVGSTDMAFIAFNKKSVHKR